MKTLCAFAVAALLAACGASSTVKPFSPTRVIGLGDAYNDVGSSGSRFTVRGTLEVATVVEQLGAYFGVGSLSTYVDAGIYVGNPVSGSRNQMPTTAGIYSYAVAGSTISGGTGSNSLADQINLALADVGGNFSDNDLIVISTGTWDIVNQTIRDKNSDNQLSIQTTGDAYTTLIESLLAHNAKHVLVMQPLEVATTPFGYAAGTYPTAVASDFTNYVKASLQTYVSRQGLTTNPIIFGAAGLSSDFNIYTSISPAAVGIFTGGSNNTIVYPSYSVMDGTSVPYCINSAQTANFSATVSSSSNAGLTNIISSPVLAANFAGCTTINNDTTNTTFYDSTLFADGLNLTPAGNRWVAGYLYNATAQGWR